MIKEEIDINEFNYELPDERIAKYPLDARDSSKQLIFRPGAVIYYQPFKRVAELIDKDSLVVFNNTKVIHARLIFKKETGARIEIFCLAPSQPVDYQQNLSSLQTCVWECMVGNLKKWKGEILEQELYVVQEKVVLKAEKLEIEEGQSPMVRFTWSGEYTFAEILEAAGQLPIPPYLNRKTEELDIQRYQTVYSKHQGSVAAPTAGLHFTDAVLSSFSDKGIEIENITLHVGAGTFQPVKTNNALEHKMHAEQFVVTRELIEKLLAQNGKIVATGTTSMRTLESIYQMGVKAKNGARVDYIYQWDWKEYSSEMSRREALKTLLDYFEKNNLDTLNAATAIMIVPGYNFKMVDVLITNFHQPKSTLLLLIAAFIGKSWKDVYEYALQNEFRFLSYGDSSILFRI